MELEAFDKVERQRQYNKYVRGTSAVVESATETSASLKKLYMLLPLN